MNTVADSVPKVPILAPAHRSDLKDVLDTIRLNYREELAQAVKVSLGVIASLSFKNRDHCLVMVLEGGSGRGKSLTIRVLNPDRATTPAVLERVDDFTPASFVSHAANRSKKQLADIDLLPRIKGKVMLTKELAPLFRDEEKELRQNFARLTAILDGEGYKTHSGTHGNRGYEGQYIFNWIGATTPIPARTYQVMAQLGNRILSYEIAGAEATEEELINFAENYETNDAVKACRKIVNDFMESHFERHPVVSIDPQEVGMTRKLQEEVVRYARLIARGRMLVSADEAELPEDPRRVVLLLQTLARGLALANDRLEVTDDDLAIIRHVAFSSVPSRRRDLLRAILTAGGSMDAAQVQQALNVSRPTTLNRMKELGGTGICKFYPGQSETSEAGRICLTEDFEWLLPPPLKILGVRGMREESICTRDPHSVKSL